VKNETVTTVKQNGEHMTGAEIVMKTAIAAGVQLCFANPGTTEIPLVTALDTIPGMRAVLGLAEGVCAGAADGYGRMLGKPAMTLLHLGAGLANGISNFHNARRARTPILNIIGEHASWHRAADSPLTMDIEALAGTVSGWQRTCESTADLSRLTAEGIAAATKGQVATLVLPHDHQWTECYEEIASVPPCLPVPVALNAVEEASKLLRSNAKSLLLLGSSALLTRGLQAATRIQAATGCDLLTETLPAHMERGLGIPVVERLPYFPELAIAALAEYQVIVLAGALAPVAFFGYKDMPSRLLLDHQRACLLAGQGANVPQALEALAEALDAPDTVTEMRSTADRSRPEPVTGKLTKESAAVTLAALQPEHAIIVDESVTCSATYSSLAAAPPHTVLGINAGSLGLGMPCAVGAALACPDRPVINFQADGSAMYTVQALWTQAREGLNITTLICSNRSYDIIKLELARAGQVPAGEKSLALTDLGNPSIDWVNISRGMGVPAASVETAEGLASELTRALSEPGPHLIEMVLA
jgi:acetolactate synthase-1/2/3 large subunit